MAINQMETTLTTRQLSEGEESSTHLISYDKMIKSETVKEPKKEPSEPLEKKIKSSVKYQYSREELVKLSTSFSAKKRPAFLDPVFNNGSGKWDPESWFNSQREDSVGPQRVVKSGGGDKPPSRRSADPKERLKEDREEVVLSPQRRSFGTGCHVTPQPSQRKSNSSPTNNDSDSGHMRRLPGSRLLSRERIEREKDRSYRNRDRDRFSDFDDGESRRYSNSRFSHDRDRRSNDRRIMRGRSDDRIEEEEEPEWFSGGPTSQSETIELVGFEPEEKNKFKKPGKRSRESSRRHSTCSEEEKETSSEVEKAAEVQPSSSAEEPQVAVEDESSPSAPPAAVDSVPTEDSPESTAPPDSAADDFDLNEILQMEWLPEMLSNGCANETTEVDPSSSRFSRWFKLDSPPPTSTEHHAGEEEEEETKDLVAKVLNGIGDLGLMDTKPSLEVTSAPEASLYPPPSSPWTKPTVAEPLPSSPNRSNNILDVLQNANLNITPLLTSEGGIMSSAPLPPPPPEKTCRVEDLEAGLKKMVLGDGTKHPSQAHLEEKNDISAFNKLLQHLGPHTDKTPSTVSMGPLDKSKVLQERDLLRTSPYFSPQPPPHPSVPIYGGRIMPEVREQPPPPPPPQSQPSASNAFIMALIQQQKQQHQQQREFLASFYKQQHQQQQQQQQHGMGPPPPPHRAPVVPGSQDMYLGVPGLSPRQSPLPGHPDGGGRIPSPLTFGQQPPALSHAPAPVHPAAQVAAAASNNLQPPILPRVPSPQELAVHTQSILQQALIKRKLEEQKEKSRKQEQQNRSKSPNIAGGCARVLPPSSTAATSAAISSNKPVMTTTFTPASVIRKLHAENKDKDVPKTIQDSMGPTLSTSSHTTVANNASLSNGMLTAPSTSSTVSPHNHDELPASRAPGMVPKAIQGQGLFATSNTQHSRPMSGRPIVKANSGGSAAEYFMKNGGSGNCPLYHHQQMNKMMEQHLLQQQLAAAQRQQLNLPLPLPQQRIMRLLANNPKAAAELVQPGGHFNLQYLVTSNNPALQQQARQHPGDLRQLPGQRVVHPIPPINMQQLLVGNQGPPPPTMPPPPQASASFRSRPHAPDGNQMGANGTLRGTGGNPAGNFLAPISTSSRHSPVNHLNKWFTLDVLKQKLSELPPVPHQNALLVEEIEQQQTVQN